MCGRTASASFEMGGGCMHLARLGTSEMLEIIISHPASAVGVDPQSRKEKSAT
jgi:hypothetical protein